MGYCMVDIQDNKEQQETVQKSRQVPAWNPLAMHGQIVDAMREYVGVVGREWSVLWVILDFTRF